MTGIGERELFEGYGVAYDAPANETTVAGASDAPEATDKAPVRTRIGSDPERRTSAPSLAQRRPDAYRA
jgi:hypothetical protein